MNINKFSKHTFWSYKKDADLSDNLIIEKVALYGELEDLIALSKLYEKEKIVKALEKLRTANAKRVNFILKVIL